MLLRGVLQQSREKTNSPYKKPQTVRLPPEKPAELLLSSHPERLGRFQFLGLFQSLWFLGGHVVPPFSRLPPRANATAQNSDLFGSAINRDPAEKSRVSSVWSQFAKISYATSSRLASSLSSLPLDISSPWDFPRGRTNWLQNDSIMPALSCLRKALAASFQARLESALIVLCRDQEEMSSRLSLPEVASCSISFGPSSLLFFRPYTSSLWLFSYALRRRLSYMQLARQCFVPFPPPNPCRLCAALSLQRLLARPTVGKVTVR